MLKPNSRANTVDHVIILASWRMGENPSMLRPFQLCLQLIPCLVFSGTSRCGAVGNVALPKHLAKLIAEIGDVISQNLKSVCFRFVVKECNTSTFDTENRWMWLL